MGKAVKNITSPLKKVAMVANPISYVGTKALGNLASNKSLTSGIAQDYGGLLGANQTNPDGSPVYSSNLDALLANAHSQGATDNKTISAYGAGEEGRMKATNQEIMDLRKNRRAELAGLLTKQADEQFQLSKPELTEQANSAGILYSSGYGDSLAKRKLDLARERENALSVNALEDVDADIAGRQGVDALGRTYRDAGQSRQFSLEDFAREGKLSKEIGATAAPAVKQSGKGGILSGAAGGAAAGSGAGPIGTGIGALAGGILGKGAAKGK